MDESQRIGIIIALAIVGLLMFVLEILTPAFGILLGLGLVALGGAVWLCFTLSGTLGFVSLIAVFVLVPVYLALVVKLLPSSPLGRRLFLGKAPDPGEGSHPERDEQRALIGREATAETDLRPSGAIRIDGRRVIATAETGLIDQGQRVRVIRAVGSNVVVRQID